MHQRGYYHISPSPTTTQHTVQFSGHAIETTVTNNASSVDSWVRTVRSLHRGRPIIVGLDCEWKPNYVRGENNKVATLQLCVDNICLIVQLFHMARNTIPHSIKSFLTDNSVTFVGVGVGDDTAKLTDDYGLHCRNWKDLEELCRDYMGMVWYPGQRRLGLKGYAREILGLVMDKPKHVTRSNWEAQNLSDAQVQYACIDAYVSYRLGSKVLEGN